MDLELLDGVIDLGRNGVGYYLVFSSFSFSACSSSSALGSSLASITGPSSVGSATLSLAQQYNSGMSTNVRIHRATGPWSEDTATFSNFGGYERAVEASFATIGDGGGIVKVDVSRPVQLWIDGSDNHGFVLEEEPGVGKAVFRASEHSNVAARPMLEICYIPEVP